MVTKEDIQKKTDEELIQIYANQIEYISEVIEWVKEEIMNRNLDVSSIHVVTEKDVESTKLEKKSKSAKESVRIWAVLQVLMGLFMIVLSIGSLIRSEVSVTVFVFFIIGLFSIILGVCSWMLLRWALFFGMIIFTVVFISNIIILISIFLQKSVLEFNALLYVFMSGIAVSGYRFMWKKLKNKSAIN